MKGQAGRKKGSNDEVRSPRDLFEALSRELGGFNLDVAATDENTLVPGERGTAYFTKELSAFDRPWWGDRGSTQAWMNPPYSRVRPWIERAIDQVANSGFEQAKPVRVAMLLKAEPTSVWWQETITRGRVRSSRFEPCGVLARGLAQKAQILHLEHSGLRFEIRFPRGRLTYGGQKQGADFPSALVLVHQVGDAWGLR